MIEPDVEAAIGRLKDAHDTISAGLGGAYVSLSATWEGGDGKLHTVSYTTTHADETDDE